MDTGVQWAAVVYSGKPFTKIVNSLSVDALNQTCLALDTTLTNFS